VRNPGFWLIVPIFLVAAFPGFSQEASPTEEERRWTRLRADLGRFCYACHGAWHREGDVDLGALDTAERLRAAPDLVRNAAGLIRSGEMPPAERLPRPDAATAERMAEDLAWMATPRGGPRDPGRPTLRRLNRREYRNTLRDLLGLDFDTTRRFPQEAAAYGFDNVGDALFLDPTLLEKYFDATEEILSAIDERPKLSGKIYASEDLSAWTSALLRRGFRRPPRPDEIATRLKIAAELRAEGASAREGQRAILASILLSPHFLYRTEDDRSAKKAKGSLGWPVSDHELAVRLSYFLWSTMPDARLRGLADAGKLSEEETLRAEVDRMLIDPRARAFAENFAGQWIGFREIKERAVDFRRFKGFNGALKRDLFEEGIQFFLHLFRQDLPATAIFDADFAFLNARLAKHYGLPPVKGKKLRRVPLADRRRGGVLGMGSVLTLTSYPLRTSPVLRGRWILETLLGSAPPPPPPEAGELPEDDRQKDGLTLRERLERHRKEPRCASCHARIDPLGFALEGFDGVGRSRDKDQGKPVDDRAQLPDGTKIQGPRGLKKALHNRMPDFRRALAKAMMIYAYGRPLAASDELSLAEICAKGEESEDRLRSFVHAVVLSHPFRHRREALPEENR
jgi:mono/diheme cytochrome c family protein